MIAPTVSVVMSVFNGRQFLREAMESILDQSFREFEFIVIDDGSTDGSGAVLDSYQRSDPRVRILHQENRGLIESLNRGCRLARCEYIARMDADDIAIRDRLRWQVDFMEKHPEVGVLGGAVEFINAVGKSTHVCFTPTEDSEIKSSLLRDCVIVHPTVLMRKDAFELAGGYRRVVVEAEDYDLWLRIADCFQLANLGTVVLKYRHHPFQISVRNRRQQALSSLAAQTAVMARRNGEPDPLDSVEEITPAVLVRLGVSEAVQQANLCRICLGRIGSMYDAGEYSSALNLTTEILRSPDWRHAEKWVIADLYLFAARLYWREGKLWRSIFATGYAIITRPITLGRPFKALLRWLRPLFAQPRTGTHPIR
jgi:glycosyltransferase involved in cell wall biosynthesis